MGTARYRGSGGSDGTYADGGGAEPRTGDVATTAVDEAVEQYGIDPIEVDDVGRIADGDLANPDTAKEVGNDPTDVDDVVGRINDGDTEL